jgi:hypothetical protein
MPDQPLPEIGVLQAAYAAFNARDIDAALALMTPNVAWPRAFKGGFVRGREEVRAYLDGAVERDQSAGGTDRFSPGGRGADIGRCAPSRAGLGRSGSCR